VDVVFLSRVQFALTIMFHYLFPPLSIGLGTIMVLMEGAYLRTGDLRYHAMTRFWSRIFAVNFAMGVATGIVMEFQFGTNWAAYSRYVGDVFGSALAAEGIFAFFLESGFLAVLVFGWDRVSKRMHFFATLMVALGSIFSAVWIVVANSWMQTPAGHVIVDGRAVIEDFWGMVFNPSSMHRLTHVVLGAFLQGAFFVTSISAFYLLRGRHLDFAKRSFTLALLFGGVCVLLMAVSGHTQARAVGRNQPAKMAALEGHYHTGPMGLNFFGVPNPAGGRIDYAVGLPGFGSFLLHDSFSASVPGLDAFREEDRPPVAIPFVSYHLMVSMAGLLTGLSALAAFFWWRGTLFEKRWLMWAFVFAVLAPFVANQTGWVAAESGRQPFLVYPEVVWDGDTPRMVTDGASPGLRTNAGMSSTKVVTAGQVLSSILMFSFVYLMLFFVWVYVLHSKIVHGPDEPEPPPATTTPKELLDAASEKQPGSKSLTATPSSPAVQEK
jgi:cytochrome d ubiquinol oxidase subunit I